MPHQSGSALSQITLSEEELMLYSLNDKGLNTGHMSFKSVNDDVSISWQTQGYVRPCTEVFCREDVAALLNNILLKKQQWTTLLRAEGTGYDAEYRCSADGSFHFSASLVVKDTAEDLESISFTPEQSQALAQFLCQHMGSDYDAVAQSWDYRPSFGLSK